MFANAAEETRVVVEVGSPARRVLLIEDNPGDARLLQEMLGEAAAPEFSLVHADRMSAALARLAAEHFDAILSDLSLPDSHGLDTFRRLFREAPGVPVVVLTSLNDTALALTAMQEGAQDYLIKGQVSADNLSRALRYAIERQQTSYYRALIMERQHFDEAIAQMSDGILIADERWRIIAANHAACLLLNLPEERCKGLLLEASLESFELSRPMAQLVNSGARAGEFALARRAPPPLYLDARVSRQIDARGRLAHVVITLRDVTAQRHAQQLQANFFRLVSHKLRAPLTVLSGYVHLFKKLPPAQLPAVCRESADILSREVERLAGTIQSLLEFKSVESLKSGAESISADLAPLIAESAAALAAQYPAKRLEIVPRIEPAAARVGAAPEHVRLILGKLMDNAAKFNKAEDIRIELTARLRTSGWVQVTVADNGPGLPHEYFDRVLEGFTQVEPFLTGEVPGLGIGLFLARRIVEAYGGRISIESTLGQGAAVSFTLPVPETVSPPPWETMI
jgi:signal transduction histidine kinase/CheY-like chemotaxis protein